MPFFLVSIQFQFSLLYYSALGPRVEKMDVTRDLKTIKIDIDIQVQCEYESWRN